MGLSTCINCGDAVEFYRVTSMSGFWVHPDKVDQGCHGTACDNDDETDAEPALDSTPSHLKG